MCGAERAEGLLLRTAGNVQVLRYVETGVLRPEGWLWRQWRKKKGPAEPGQNAK